MKTIRFCENVINMVLYLLRILYMISKITNIISSLHQGIMKVR